MNYDDKKLYLVSWNEADDNYGTGQWSLKNKKKRSFCSAGTAIVQS